jgi:hypothetical protein
MECEFWVSKINFGFLYPAKGVQNLFWAVGSPKFILGGWESKIYFGAVGSPKFILGRLGVQNLFWSGWESKIYFGAFGSPKFILDDSHPCTFNHTLLPLHIIEFCRGIPIWFQYARNPIFAKNRISWFKKVVMTIPSPIR